MKGFKQKIEFISNDNWLSLRLSSSLLKKATPLYRSDILQNLTLRNLIKICVLSIICAAVNVGSVQGVVRDRRLSAVALPSSEQSSADRCDG